jgi:hypothetical protein
VAAQRLWHCLSVLNIHAVQCLSTCTFQHPSAEASEPWTGLYGEVVPNILISCVKSMLLLLLLQVATLFDEDGIEVRFINSDAQGNGIK